MIDGGILCGCRAVTFDLAGTLVVPDPQLVDYAVDPHYQWDAVVHGFTFSSDGFAATAPIGAVAATVGVSNEILLTYVDKLQEIHMKPEVWCKPTPFSAEVICALKQMGLQVGIVTNTVGGTGAEVAARSGVMGGCSSAVPLVDSALVGVQKPDPRIFMIAAGEVGIPLRYLCHVGDRIVDDVKGAVDAGANSIHFDPFGFCLQVGHSHIADMRYLVDPHISPL